jgi:hypothetical protein
MGKPHFPIRHRKTADCGGRKSRLNLSLAPGPPDLPSRLPPHHGDAHLLQAKVDITSIALLLGHESPVTTHKYVEADVEMKKKTLSRLKEPTGKLATFAPKDALLAFLERL